MYVHLNPLPVPCTILRYTGVSAALGSVVPRLVSKSLVRGLTYKH